LAIVLHHDNVNGQLAQRLTDALTQVLPFERDKSSPRVSGAFVFDSVAYYLEPQEVSPVVLWCPADTSEDLDLVNTASLRSCPLQPDIPDLRLGPFSFANLPILPTRTQYLKFLEKYTDAQAGEMRELHFLAPERTPLSENVPLGDYGVVTFFNQEMITAVPSDVFSYCGSQELRSLIVVFRTEFDPTPTDLVYLPWDHQDAPQPFYNLGLRWDFSFLTRATYEVVVAGSATGFSLTVPFGIGNSTDSYYGTTIWETGEFPLDKVLLKCTRFCHHPTFDSRGIYNVNSIFSTTYLSQCYDPRFPTAEQGGFPPDP